MNKNAIIAIVVIVVIAVAGVGIYLMLPPPEEEPPNMNDNPNEVAIVFATGGLGDKSFNDGVFTGATKAHDDHNINFTYSEPTAITDYEPMLRAYAAHTGMNEAYDILISVGFDQADAVMAVAEDYPNQKMAIIDMWINNTVYANVSSVLFSENQGSALVGAIAGMMTTTNKIGFLGGMDIDLIRKFAAGYVYGANLTNPGIAHVEQYVGDWANIALGKTLTHGMYEVDADIVFAAAGRSGLGAFDAVKEDNETSDHKLWVIGVDSPQMYLGCADPDNPEPPTLCLTSMLKRVDIAAYDLMVDAVVGTFTSGYKFYDLANNGHSYEINTALLTLPQEVTDTVAMIREGIINGTYVVPTDVYWS